MDDLLRRNRKYTFAWACLLIITVMLAWDKLDGENFITGLGLIIGAYMVGNVGEHYTKQFGKKNVQVETDS